ncbi:MAG: hypothetical protein PHG27_05755 [Massilibacteroides sp.]|nr:hypothetical protein [Massilibacteroides sp.]MDD3061796.1 hypothetical protein [Massilibacteroides sp.]MDD4115089.1 hypothetical protein [Massilibacteroides sp.]MDD4660078.1 hypothetical protein [Massilibacteroides sp.]
MYKIFIITFATFSFLLTGPLSATDRQQGRQFDRKAFIEKRNAFLIAEVELTPEEAAKFLPLYEEFQRKKFEAGNRCRRLSREIREKRKVRETDYAHVVDECVGVKLREAKLEKEYYDKFKKILPPRKVYRLTEAEYKFAREFMRGSRYKK